MLEADIKSNKVTGAVPIRGAVLAAGIEVRHQGGYTDAEVAATGGRGASTCNHYMHEPLRAIVVTS
jgi:hypothetical protein